MYEYYMLEKEKQCSLCGVVTEYGVLCAINQICDAFLFGMDGELGS